MTAEEKKAYVEEASARLKKAIGEKLADIRTLISVEANQMAECGGADAAESILCAVDCTYDQVDCALGSWEVPGENA